MFITTKASVGVSLNADRVNILSKFSAFFGSCCKNEEKKEIKNKILKKQSIHGNQTKSDMTSYTSTDREYKRWSVSNKTELIDAKETDMWIQDTEE